jgi:hypothetical protein
MTVVHACTTAESVPSAGLIAVITPVHHLLRTDDHTSRGSPTEETWHGSPPASQCRGEHRHIHMHREKPLLPYLLHVISISIGIGIETRSEISVNPEFRLQ